MGLTEPLNGLPAALLALVVSAAVAAGALAVSRRLGLAARLFPMSPAAPPPTERVRQLVACADYGSDYGLSALPDFPACAGDPALARAARLAADHPHPDDLSAVLDAELRDWITGRVKTSVLVRRTASLLSVSGILGLLAGVVGAGAIAGGWFPVGFWAPVTVFVAVMFGILATALGSARVGRRVVADPALILDRQLIAAAMVALRQAKGPQEIEAILVGFLPATDRGLAAPRARAA